jgi:hypothetical protein
MAKVYLVFKVNKSVLIGIENLFFNQTQEGKLTNFCNAATLVWIELTLFQDKTREKLIFSVKHIKTN